MRIAQQISLLLSGTLAATAWNPSLGKGQR